jgi:hypothetical protein
LISCIVLSLSCSPALSPTQNARSASGRDPAYVLARSRDPGEPATGSSPREAAGALERDPDLAMSGSGGPEGRGPGGDVKALAKAAQNPIADMISLPLQYNFSPGVGPHKRGRHTLNVQPVIPISLSKDWNLITRTIMPVESWPNGPHDSNRCGLGDLNTSLFLSPAEPGKWTWGAGPIFTFPTATDDVLGTGKWGAGPTAVLLRSQGNWLYGGLVSNVWSYAGDSDRKSVSTMSVQPFINYNLPKGWYLSTSPIITANWKADSDNCWTIPLGGGFGKIVRIGDQPVNVSLKAYYNVEHPDNAAEWLFQLQVTFLFPKGKK